MRSNERQLEENDPCWKERQMVYKCLINNDSDQEKCKVHLANSKSCKDFWYKITRERMRKGIEPQLPNIHERIQIKEEYMRKKREFLNAEANKTNSK